MTSSAGLAHCCWLPGCTTVQHAHASAPSSQLNSAKCMSASAPVVCRVHALLARRLLGGGRQRRQVLRSEQREGGAKLLGPVGVPQQPGPGDEAAAGALQRFILDRRQLRRAAGRQHVAQQLQRGVANVAQRVPIADQHGRGQALQRGHRHGAPPAAGSSGGGGAVGGEGGAGRPRAGRALRPGSSPRPCGSVAPSGPARPALSPRQTRPARGELLRSASVLPNPVKVRADRWKGRLPAGQPSSPPPPPPPQRAAAAAASASSLPCDCAHSHSGAAPSEYSPHDSWCVVPTPPPATATLPPPQHHQPPPCSVLPAPNATSSLSAAPCLSCSASSATSHPTLVHAYLYVEMKCIYRIGGSAQAMYLLDTRRGSAWMKMAKCGMGQGAGEWRAHMVGKEQGGVAGGHACGSREKRFA